MPPPPTKPRTAAARMFVSNRYSVKETNSGPSWGRTHQRVDCAEDVERGPGRVEGPARGCVPGRGQREGNCQDRGDRRAQERDLQGLEGSAKRLAQHAGIRGQHAPDELQHEWDALDEAMEGDLGGP